MNYQAAIYVVSAGADGPVQAFLDEMLAEQYADLYRGSAKKIAFTNSRVREMTELEEKQANCPYCHDGRNANPLIDEKSRDFLAFDVNGIVTFGTDGNFSVSDVGLFKFCPMCGRKLGEGQ